VCPCVFVHGPPPGRTGTRPTAQSHSRAHSTSCHIRHRPDSCILTMSHCNGFACPTISFQQLIWMIFQDFVPHPFERETLVHTKTFWSRVKPRDLIVERILVHIFVSCSWQAGHTICTVFDARLVRHGADVRRGVCPVLRLLLFLQMACLPCRSRTCFAARVVLLAPVLLLMLSCARSTDCMFDVHVRFYLLCSMRDSCVTMLMFGVACPAVRCIVVHADDMFAE
jgi:hypothetical protein